MSYLLVLLHGDIQKLETLADLFLEEPDELLYYLENALSSGLSYPKALAEATMLYLKSSEYAKILDEPNNVLGIEYIKQIKRQNFEVTAITIQRNGEGHFSQNLSSFASGSRIREAILNGENYSNSVPEYVYDLIRENISNVNITSLKPFEQILFYKIRDMDISTLKNISDVTEGLENRIKKASYISSDLEELIANIKSKRFTESKIRRILVSILLNITKKDMQIAKSTIPYVRVLGFNHKGKELISTIARANPNIDIIISVASFEKNNLNKNKQIILNKDILATDIFVLASDPILPAKLDYTMKVYDDDNYM